MACRLPGAGDVTQFWRNLAAGVESVEFSTLEEQAALGVPEYMLKDPNFVPASAGLDDIECFDAAFFGMSAREAELRDPQHRLFLELAYTALEDSGYDPARYAGEIGVYAGTGEDAYQWRNTRRNPRAFAAAGSLGVTVSSHPDYVATFTSFKLDLRGPSLTLHTACSTSLVAVHVACEALRNGECDMALTGGVNMDLPLGWGHLYFQDGVYTPDGHTRTFDARAAGTLWSDGGGIVVLKRLSDAVADGDCIRAVVLGNAINNDGSAKVGYTAPSQQGQAAVIAQALGVADVDPRTISYVEAHGTGTALGDPIEVAALSGAYRRYCADVGWCAIGSVKTNVGHLGPAAGIAGVIKTVLALEHRLIPPSLNFESPNPKIDFPESPFHVNTTLSPWETGGLPRRAAVSSFGVGGTNAHIIVEEAPPAVRHRPDPRPVHLVQLSARSETALTDAAQRLADRLADDQEPASNGLHAADVAYTLRVGRRQLPHRLAVVAADPADAAAAISSPRRRIAGVAGQSAPRVAFMFSGQGAQYPGMGSGLYRTESVFRETVDVCSQELRGQLGEDLRELMFAAGDEAAESRLRQTAMTQPALFTIEYALARLWQSVGVEPAAMVGHSIGEYVAATLAGVLSLSDALQLVATRGRLMQQMPAGAMLAVRLAEAELRDRLPDGMSVAAINGPNSCVVAGTQAQVAAFARELDHDGVGNRPLRTSHAFHSQLMEPVAASFRAAVAAVDRHPPQLPLLADVTGDWMTAADAVDPSYWARQLREPVRFADCLATLLGEGGWLLLECGPGRQLCELAGQQQGAGRVPAVPSLPGAADSKSDLEVLYAAAGRLWASGVELDQDALCSPGYRIPLPTYPWERKPYWIKPRSDGSDLDGAPDALTGQARPLDNWFAVPAWQQLPPNGMARRQPGRCLVFSGPAGDPATRAVVYALSSAGADVIQVRPGEAFGRDGEGHVTIRPAAREDYDALLAELGPAGVPPHIVHAWALIFGPGPKTASHAQSSPGPDATAGTHGRPRQEPEAAWQAQDLTFFSLLCLVQALAAAQPDGGVHIDVLTVGAQDVTGTDLIRPEHATVAGIAKVVPLELPWLSVRHLDLDPGQNLTGNPRAASLLTAELLAERTADAGGEVALRAGRRWRREYRPVTVPAERDGMLPGPGLRDGGVYVITGGLGGIGITLAEELARQVHARLVLVSRSGLPPRSDWEALTAAQGGAGRARRAIAAIQRMEKAGAEVLLIAADVASRTEAAQVRARALERFGRVDGIVHAAGVPGGGMAEVKERAAAEQVLRPKLTGTLALREAFGDLELDFVMLCSSVTAIAGGFGQVDYCAANNFLDAYARSAHGWRTAVVSANWGNWLDVGMAAEVAAPAAFRALQRGDRLSPVDHPLITGRHAGADGTPGWCSGVVSAGTHWVLDEHRLAGVPVLPGTAYLEVARSAFAAVSAPPTPDHVVELRDVAFVEPMTVLDGTSAEIQVLFTSGTDGLDFQVVSLTGDNARTHARGSATWASAGPGSAAVSDLAAIRARCSLALREGEDVRSVSGLLTFGPRWNNVRRVQMGRQEELALLEAAEPVAAELGRWVLHPALLDAATAFGMTREGERYLPLGYGSIVIRRPLTARFWSHLRHRDTGSSEVIGCDITLLDDAGQVLASISDFTMRRVDPAAVTAMVRTADPARPGTAAGLARPGTAGETPTGAEFATGIRPADGAAAFRRMTGVDLGPQVVISAQPVDQVIAAAQQVTHEAVATDLSAATSADGPQPEADDYVAPRTGLEAVIARLWGELLGVSRVGVTDNFFEIGGNSLIAVQLIALIRKEAGVRLPMRSVFDEPTVAGVAAKVEELRNEH